MSLVIASAQTSCAVTADAAPGLIEMSFDRLKPVRRRKGPMSPANVRMPYGAEILAPVGARPMAQKLETEPRN